MHWVRSWASQGIQTAMWHDCKPARPCPMPLHRQTFTIAVARLDVRSMVCRCLQAYRDCLSLLQLWDKCMTSAYSSNLQVKKKHSSTFTATWGLSSVRHLVQSCRRSPMRTGADGNGWKGRPNLCFPFEGHTCWTLGCGTFRGSAGEKFIHKWSPSSTFLQHQQSKRERA